MWHYIHKKEELKCKALKMCLNLRDYQLNIDWYKHKKDVLYKPQGSHRPKTYNR